jgi:L,D-transpeptidase catalytic domain
MAMVSAQHAAASPRSARKRFLLGLVIGGMVLVVGLALATWTLSGVTLAGDSTALARIAVQPLGGTIERVEAFGPRGHRLPLAIEGGRLTPLRKLTPGEQVSVQVEVRRPGWIGWALGAQHSERLTLRAPAARVSEPWMTVRAGAAVRVRFDQPVSAVAYGSGGHLTRRALSAPQSSISLGARAKPGAIEVAAAARPWEKLGARMPVSWFPRSRRPVMVSLPAAGTPLAPATQLRLTFSEPVGDVLGSGRPRLVPSTPGRWRKTSSHTLVFTPSGFGAALGSRLRVQLPHQVAVTAGAAGGLRETDRIEWPVPPGSTLRLQQLLAQAGYLPVDWRPAGAHVARTPSAEAQAAADPPSGSFHWRYHDTPRQLKALWTAGRANVITKGAVMKFEHAHNLTVDGLAGAAVWRALLHDALAAKRLHEGYSYVYVHRAAPETVTLWHAGRTILTSAANTGISQAETELGTFPVFEHIAEGTMSGTNPDGSHYEDPGIKWISYFNGGDALHNFDRASFGSPQSLGCVELPLAASAEIWPYTPIGTLVTVEA